MTNSEPSFSSCLVELGLPDGPLTTQDDEADDLYTSKIGGFPVFANEELSQIQPKCGCCGSDMYLILQMDAPLPDTSMIDRIFYAFACNSVKCAATPEGWRAFFTLIQPEKPAPIQACQLPKKNFWEADFLPEESLSNLSLKDKKEEEEKKQYFAMSSYPVQFPATALRIVEEFWQDPKKKPESVLPIAHATLASEDPDFYEKIMPVGVDKQFEKFQKRTAAYPRQCVRYSPGGHPLSFNSNPLPQSPPLCPKCQQPQHFELQLTPAILNYLPVSNPKYLRHIQPEARSKHPLFGDEMQWGTVIVYSCGLGCHLLEDRNAECPATCLIQLE